MLSLEPPALNHAIELPPTTHQEAGMGAAG